ncbi:MAG: LysR family transcriptional regulator [Myxococcota bacterium]
MEGRLEWDWDHVRIFLAVMRASSLRQAADKLGVSHPTIARRLEAFETQLGLQLFDRRSDGLHATPQAVKLVPLAEEVERSMNALGRGALDADEELRGSVRVTAPRLLLTDLLMPELAAFRERWPQLDLHVDADSNLADLASREADVAIRGVVHGKLPDERLTGRLAATSHHAVYGTGNEWIGWYGDKRDRAWIRDTPFPDLPVRGCFNDPALQRAACVAGMGLTLLPCHYADAHLSRRTKPKPAFDLWVLVHPDLKRSPRLRVFRDEMVAALKRLQPRLAGKPAKKTAKKRKRRS